MSNHHLTWVQLHDLNQVNQQYGKEQASTEQLLPILQQQDALLAKLYAEIPSNSVCILLTGFGNVHHISHLVHSKQGQKEVDPELEKQIQQAYDQSSNALVFIGVKE